MKEECTNAERRELDARMEHLEVDNKKQEIVIKMLKAENKAKREAVTELEALRRGKKRVDRGEVEGTEGQHEGEEVKEVAAEEVETMMGEEVAGQAVEMDEAAGLEGSLEREVGAGFLEGEVVLVNLNSSKHQWPGQVLASSSNRLTVQIFDKKGSKRTVEAADAKQFPLNNNLLDTTNCELKNAFSKAKKLGRSL